MELLKIKISKKDYTWTIVVFIFLMENCFKLINTDTVNISGAFAYSDIWLGLFILYFGIKFVKFSKMKDGGLFFTFIVLIEVMCVVAAVQQKYYTSQPISLGIRPQRNFMIILLSYFVITKMSEKEEINWEKLFDYFVVWGTVSSILYIIQKLLYPSVQFLYALMNYRNGSLRIYGDSSLIDIAILIAAYRLFSSFRIKYMCTVLLGGVYLFWISQGRMEIISILIGIIIGFLLTRKFEKKKLVLGIILVLAIGMFFVSAYGRNLVESIMSAKELGETQGNTMAIRYMGREFYFEQLYSSIRSLLFGCGYPNSLYAPAMQRAGFNLKIGLSDNGIFGFLYVYGFLGVLLVISVVILATKKSIEIRKYKNDSVPLMYIVTMVIMSYNVIFWYWNADGTFILVLMLCYIEREYRKIIKKKKEMKKDDTFCKSMGK